uniref:Apple domain-containing protein n=1 Tax=Aplanochytrium stocchinoi TaxID=215587 RepID=A0A7S3PNE8_9STRA|mmetsp:Transcript_32390/g.39867  ORF Transcript_32390/g.39867 Transcript_32390/m.39867 type:complete len:544 (-) Transcript_32390:515-2146(-)
MKYTAIILNMNFTRKLIYKKGTGQANSKKEVTELNKSNLELKFNLQKIFLQKIWPEIKVLCSLFATYAFNENSHTFPGFIPKDVIKLKFLLIICTVVSCLGFLYLLDGNPDPFFIGHRNLYCSKTLGSESLQRFPSALEFRSTLETCRELCIANRNCSVFTYGRWEKGLRPLLGFGAEMRCQLFSKCKPSFWGGTDAYLKNFNVVLFAYFLNFPINVLALLGGFRCILLCLSLASALLLILGLTLLCTLLTPGIKTMVSLTETIYVFLFQASFVYLLLSTALQLKCRRRQSLQRENRKSGRLRELEALLKEEVLSLGQTKMRLFTWSQIIDLVLSSTTMLLITILIIQGSEWIFFDNTFMRNFNLFNISTRVVFGIMGDKIIYVLVLGLAANVVASSKEASNILGKIKTTCTCLLSYDMNAELIFLAVNIARDAVHYENQLLEAIVTEKIIRSSGHRKDSRELYFQRCISKLRSESRTTQTIQKTVDPIPSAIRSNLKAYTNHKAITILRKCLTFDTDEISTKYIHQYPVFWNDNAIFGIRHG